MWTRPSRCTGTYWTWWGRGTTSCSPPTWTTSSSARALTNTQGDYGLWQCSKPCHAKTYDNQETVRRMLEEQRDMRVPAGLVPYCPVCGRPMAMNLRADDTFVEDEGWHAAARRYEAFLRRCQGKRVLFLELGVGGNTPVIIKYPFWKMTLQNKNSAYACINQEDTYVPGEIRRRSVCITGDIGMILKRLPTATLCNQPLCGTL